MVCPHFSHMPLPYAGNIWQAETAAECTTQYREWLALCPERLKGKHAVSWIEGRETGLEDALGQWIQHSGELGDIIFACARAQVSERANLQVDEH
jgi:hypothetical protein